LLFQAPATVDEVLSGSARFTIIEGDCLDALRRVGDECIDSLVTDPPYGINYKPDVGKPIANDKRPFIWWLYDAYRVLKPGGGLVCFCRWDVQESFRLAIETAGFRVRNQLVWDKISHGGQGDTRAQFIMAHEVMWFAVKGRFSFPGGRPASVMAHRIPTHAQRTHPTEKPTELMRDLVRAITPENGVVLDPCAGTGATIVAAIEDGFRGIAIEVDGGYAKTARSRAGRAEKLRSRRVATGSSHA
jgi:DNA modification methylase